ncbi:MAG: lysine--tRNA ligase [Candidatus Aenigmarchaeota archaeon]|nr:lysine--tRNA ligase [Candidatus Aenigmarchaeota archaeon]
MSYTWSDKVVEELKKRNVKKHVVHGMWTPSGFFHIGNARPELFTPTIVANSLKDAGLKVEHNFIVDDFDDLDKIPKGFDKNKFSQYLGKPLREVPSPVQGFDSWADYFMSQIKDVADKFGIKPNFMSAYDSYHSGRYDEAIKIILEKSDKIREIMKKIAGVEKPKEWLPLMVVCEKCGRSATTTAISWDGEYLSYKCNRDREYVKSCGYEGRIKPAGGHVKIPWRIYWAATWFSFGVTFESGGKDHFTPGGSVDTGRAFAREIFGIEPPILYGTEFIQLGKEKMSGSKGNLISMKDWLNFAEPELLRFLYASYQPGKVINFDLKSNKFLLLVERYDMSERCYFGVIDKCLRHDEKRIAQLKRIYELSQIDKSILSLDKLPYQFSYSMAALYSQLYNEEQTIEVLKKLGHVNVLTDFEKKRISKRLRLAKYWVEHYNPSMTIKINESLPQLDLNKKEKECLLDLSKELDKEWAEEELQQRIYDLAREHEIEPKRFFQLCYRILINKTSGPKLAGFILMLGKERVKKIFGNLG